MKAKILGFTLLFCGILSIFFAVFLSRQDKNSVSTQSVLANQIEYSKGSERCPDSLPAGQKVGCDFETWVLTQFDSRIFVPETWNRSGSLENLATGSGIPDLFFKFQTESRKDSFHVECVFRTSLSDGYYSWGSDEKVRQLKEFANSSPDPVFLVIGLGGSPKAPNTVWVLELTSSLAAKLRLKDLPRSKPIGESGFKYNPHSRILK